MSRAPQLANPIGVEELEAYIKKAEWVFEQKLDGERRMVQVTDGKVKGINRRGVQAVIKPSISSVFSAFNGRWLFDGELVDEVLWVFDLPVAEAPGYEGQPYEVRRTVLEQVMSTIESPTVRLVPVATTTREKLSLVRRCAENNAEGVMVKHRAGRYVYGPSRSRWMLKAKFWETVDCIVSQVGIDGKRNVGTALYGPDGRLVDTGTCKVSDYFLETLDVGDVIEVKYLYVHPDSYKMFQPSFLKVRDDKAPQECTTDQLKIGCKEVLRLP